MDCKIVEEKIIDYMSGEISGPSAEEIATHLQQCENCRKDATTLRKTMAALKNGYSEKSLLELASSKTDPVTMTLSTDRLKVLETARDEWILTHAPAGFSMAEFTSRVVTKPGIPEEEPGDIYKNIADGQAKDTELIASSSDKAKETKAPPVEAPRSKSTVRPALDPDITPVYLTRQKKNDLKRTTMKFKLPLQESMFQKFRRNWFKPLALSMSCAGIAFLAIYVNDFSFVYKDDSLRTQRAEIASTSVSYVKGKTSTGKADDSTGKMDAPSFPIAKENPSTEKEENSMAGASFSDNTDTTRPIREPATREILSDEPGGRIGNASPLPPAPLPQISKSRLSGTIESRALREISVTEELITLSEDKSRQYSDESDVASNVDDSDGVSNVDESFGARRFSALSDTESADISVSSIKRELKKSKSYARPQEFAATSSLGESDSLKQNYDSSVLGYSSVAKLSSAKMISQPSAPRKSASPASTLIISPFDSRQIVSISNEDEVRIISKDYSVNSGERDSIDAEIMHIPFEKASVAFKQKILSYYAKRLIESRTTAPVDLLSKLRTILRREADNLLPLIEKEIEQNELAAIVEEACK